MANKKISELPLATTPLAGTEEAEIVQGGLNKRTPVSTIGSASAASETTSGIAELATQAETNTRTDDARIVTPLKLANQNFLAPLASPVFTGNVTIPNLLGKYAIDQVSTSVAGATITLDMNSQIQRSHIGSATFATAKTLAMSNTTNSLFFNFIFEITSVSATLTFPADWISSSPDFNGTLWTPLDTGRFQFGGAFDDTNNLWYITISGPFI